MLSKKLALAAVSLVVTFFSAQPVIAADSHQTKHEHHHSADSHANEHEHHHRDDGHANEHEHHTASASLSYEICLVSEHV